MGIFNKIIECLQCFNTRDIKYVELDDDIRGYLKPTDVEPFFITLETYFNVLLKRDKFIVCDIVEEIKLNIGF